MEDKLNFTLTGDNVLVMMDDAATVTDAGIKLPAGTEGFLNTGVVAALGPLFDVKYQEISQDAWRPYPENFKIGCRLLLLEGVQSVVEIPGMSGRFMLVDSSDIALVLNDIEPEEKVECPD